VQRTLSQTAGCKSMTSIGRRRPLAGRVGHRVAGRFGEQKAREDPEPPQTLELKQLWSASGGDTAVARVVKVTNTWAHVQKRRELFSAEEIENP